MQEIFKRAHNNKRQYFIEPFRAANTSIFDDRFCPARSFYLV